MFLDRQLGAAKAFTKGLSKLGEGTLDIKKQGKLKDLTSPPPISSFLLIKITY